MASILVGSSSPHHQPESFVPASTIVSFGAEIGRKLRTPGMIGMQHHFVRNHLQNSRQDRDDTILRLRAVRGLVSESGCSARVFYEVVWHEYPWVLMGHETGSLDLGEAHVLGWTGDD